MASGLPTNNYLRVDDVAAELFSLPPAAALQFQAFLTKKTRKRINYFQLKQKQQKKLISYNNKKLNYRRETARQLPTWRG